MSQRSTSCTKDRFECLVALGSNQPLEDITPDNLVQIAIGKLEEVGVTVNKISKFYKTLAYPAGSGPDFVNAVVLGETKLSAQELLKKLHEIESYFARVRDSRWAPRTLDLDLIDFCGSVMPDVDTHEHWVNATDAQQRTRAPDQLILPHPRLQDRAFVLIPLADVVPGWTHPVTGRSLTELIDDLPLKMRQETTIL